MSQMPSHIVSLLFYCRRCKSTHTLLHPDKNIKWNVSQKVDGDDAYGELLMTVKCPTCQRDVEISLKKWKQSQTD